MVTYDLAISSFSKLTYDQKKEKVVTMLEMLKEDGNIFEDLWNLVNISDNVSESILDMIFQVITKAMYTVKEEEMENALEKLESMKNRVSNLQSQGREEEEADEILSKLW